MQPIRSMLVLLVVVLALVVAAVAIDPMRPTLTTSPLFEGIYVSTSEIRGFTGTILELKSGKFRFWFYSDVGSNDTELPEAGTYTVKDGSVQLSTGRSWYVGNVGSIGLLWRDDALHAWEYDERIYDYGILMRTDAAVPAHWWEIECPSIDEVKRALGRPTPNWRGPFVVGPQ